MSPERTSGWVFLALGHDHEQIIIAVRPRLSPGTRPEQDDLLRVELLNEPPHDLRQDIGLGGLHRLASISSCGSHRAFCHVHDTFSNRSAVDRSATSSAFMTASVSNSTSIEPPPVRSVAETTRRPSLVDGELDADRAAGRQAVGEVERGDADVLAVVRVGAVALAGHHADVDGRLVGGVGAEVGHPLQRDLGVAGQEVDDHVLALVVAGDHAQALAQDVDDPGIDQLADRAGQGEAELLLEVVEGLGDLLLGDRGQVEPAWPSAVGRGTVGREDVLDLVARAIP